LENDQQFVSFLGEAIWGEEFWREF
jgi:hypothetical protein